MKSVGVFDILGPIMVGPSSSHTAGAARLGKVARAVAGADIEEVIDDLQDDLKIRHIERLKNGQCTIELGFILSDIMTNYERIADHCSNIAVCVLQLEERDLEAHDYLIKMKTDNEDFKQKYKKYKNLYVLPQCDRM